MTPITPDERRTRGSLAPGALGLAAALLVILGATLFPVRAEHRPDFVACLVCGQRGTGDALANLILFAPLGAALAVIGYFGFLPVFYAFLLSCGIELAQMIIPGRDPSLGDVAFNTLGALVGLVVARVGRHWLAPDARTAARCSAGAGVAAVCVFGLTAWMLTPIFTASSYRAWWTPALDELAWYRGRVVQTTLDSMPLRAGELPRSGEIRRLLRSGAPLRIGAVAGPRSKSLGTLLVIEDDRERAMLLIGVDRDDLVLRHHTRAAELRLDQPDLRLRGALAHVVPGDTLHITVHKSGGHYCLTLNRSGACPVGFTIGAGWALVLYPAHFPLGLQQVLGAAWVAGLAFPVGLWFRKRPESLLAAGVLLAGAFLLPPSAGLLPTPPMELLGVAGGWSLGVGLQRLLKNAQ